MSDTILTAIDPSRQRLMALSRWDNEGGAVSASPPLANVSGEEERDVPELTNTELVQLRIRVIALENAMITLLAGAPDTQLDLVREMARLISPRPDSTQHPLTIHAARQMNHLVDRALHFRIEPHDEAVTDVGQGVAQNLDPPPEPGGSGLEVILDRRDESP